VTASGTLVWSYDVDTTTLVAGVHTLRARATDSDDEVSSTAEVQFTVDEPSVEEEGSTPWYDNWVVWALILLIVIPVVVAILVVIRNR
jgi:hypothetical protein